MNFSDTTTKMKATPGIFRRKTLAFSLIEMLIVIAIIGILAGIGLPHLKGWGDANSMTAATRQLMDDLAFARLKAISSRSPVYVVFVSSDVVEPGFYNPLSVDEKARARALWSGQFTSYALFTPRNVGDQPGHPTARYLTPWKTLPDNIFIPTRKFDRVANRFATPETNRPFSYQTVPFPSATNVTVSISLPCIQFNSRGQLVSEQNPSGQLEGATIPLARGSIFYARDADGTPILGPADVIETPAQNSVTDKNWIRIDWLTGRARVERLQIQ